MNATRTRFEVIEWAVAAGFLAALFAAGTIAMREFRTIGKVTSVIAREARTVAQIPPAVPSRAVSVPMLLLSDGRDVRVGDTLSSIAARLGRQAEVGTQSVDQMPQGERLTRFYEHAGTRFVLVFEPFEHDTEARVAAIYLQ